MVWDRRPGWKMWTQNPRSTRVWRCQPQWKTQPTTNPWSSIARNIKLELNAPPVPRNSLFTQRRQQIIRGRTAASPDKRSEHLLMCQEFKSYRSIWYSTWQPLLLRFFMRDGTPAMQKRMSRNVMSWLRARARPVVSAQCSHNALRRAIVEQTQMTH